MEDTLEFFILKARFQQKQLQEKEAKLLRLYEEQAERALKTVGGRSRSGGSSGGSVGAGKVRHMFRARRGDSESRLCAPIAGRDKSYPLEPLTKNRSDRPTRVAREAPRRRTFSSDRETCSDFEEEFPREPRTTRADHGQSFRLVDDPCRKVRNGNECPLDNFGDKRQFRESRWKSEESEKRTFRRASPEPERGMDGRYKSYVSQGTFARKAHLGSGALGTTSRPGVAAKQPTPAKETPASGYLNGSASSPVRKIRKPTPVPLSVAPSQALLQKEMRKATRVEPIKEVPSSTSRASAPRTASTPGSLQKPPTSGRSLPTGRGVAPKPAPPAPVQRSAPPPGLVDCRICGRHFAPERVAKHEEVCQKSTRKQRKPFDALQQRVKGTEVEQYVRKSSKSLRSQPEKTTKPQSNWRKKHEEFINNIRAAKEVSAHLKKGGKLSDLPPPPPSDYSDYVPCPHCGRKFNSAAADRHIPKCANIINNKPKGAVPRGGALKQGARLLQAATPSARGRK